MLVFETVGLAKSKLECPWLQPELQLPAHLQLAHDLAGSTVKQTSLSPCAVGKRRPCK